MLVFWKISAANTLNVIMFGVAFNQEHKWSQVEILCNWFWNLVTSYWHPPTDYATRPSKHIIYCCQWGLLWSHENLSLGFPLLLCLHLTENQFDKYYLHFFFDGWEWVLCSKPTITKHGNTYFVPLLLILGRLLFLVVIMVITLWMIVNLLTMLIIIISMQKASRVCGSCCL